MNPPPKVKFVEKWTKLYQSASLAGEDLAGTLRVVHGTVTPSAAGTLSGDQGVSIDTLDPATHLFLCWEGWNVADKDRVGELVAQSTTVYCVCFVHRGKNPFQGLSKWEGLKFHGDRQSVKLMDTGEECVDQLFASTYTVTGRKPVCGGASPPRGLLLLPQCDAPSGKQ